MSTLLPTTVSAREVQRNYRGIFELAKKKSPVIVLTNNKPDVAIIKIEDLEALYEKSQQAELQMALQAIKVYEKEKTKKKLRKLTSLDELS